MVLGVQCTQPTFKQHVYDVVNKKTSHSGVSSGKFLSFVTTMIYLLSFPHRCRQNEMLVIR